VDGWRTVAVADGVELAYRIVGRGEPTVVVPAGSIMGGMDRLAAHHRVVLYDARGRGRSTRFAPDLPISLEHDLADLEALRAALGLERFAVLGISYYGTLAALYASERPERVERVVMVGPMALSAETFAGAWDAAAAAEKEVADAGAEAELTALRAAGLDAADPAAYCRAYARAYAPGLYADPARFDPEPAAVVCELPNERPASVGGWAGALFGGLGDWDFAERLRRVRAATLILQGRQDLRTPPAGGEEIAKTIPDARVVWIDGCGHVPLKERPEIAYPAVLEFLRGSWPESAASPAVAP
jgi:pimeloyl-ACP methyl ester carboxylesterase